MLAEALLSSLRLALRGADAPKLVVKSANALVRASRIGGRVAFAVTNAKTSARIEGMNGNVSVAHCQCDKGDHRPLRAGCAWREPQVSHAIDCDGQYHWWGDTRCPDLSRRW